MNNRLENVLDQDAARFDVIPHRETDTGRDSLEACGVSTSSEHGTPIRMHRVPEPFPEETPDEPRRVHEDEEQAPEREQDPEEEPVAVP